MLHSIKALATLSTLLIISGASNSSGKSFDSPIGEWNEQYESMSGDMRSSTVTIIDESKGIYTNPNGRIEFYAIDEQGKWKGYWIEEGGSDPCSEEKSGSMFWGEQTFKFDDTYDQYVGTWDMCGEGRKYTTKGVR